MPAITFNNITNVGVILKYIAGEQSFYLPYMRASGPPSWNVFKAEDNEGNITFAWSATEQGWNGLSAAVESAVDAIMEGTYITYAGTVEEQMPEGYSIIYDPY